METSTTAAAEVKQTSEQQGYHPIRRVMLIDDEDPIRNVMTKILTHMLHYEVDSFPQGQAAYNRLAHIAEKMPGHYNLVLSDICMPEMDGITLAKKTYEILPNLPFIFMTGHDPRDVKEKPVNVREVLLKPVGIPGLEEVIKKYIG